MPLTHQTKWHRWLIWLLWFDYFADQRLVNVRNDTTARNGSFNQRVQLLVSSDRQLQVTWVDSFYFKIFACVAGQLQDLSC